MKKLYKKLDLELVRFTVEDIITTSGDPSCAPVAECTVVEECSPMAQCECHGHGNYCEYVDCPTVCEKVSL